MTTTEKRIKELLNRKGWSLGDLANESDIPKTTLHRYLSDTGMIPLDRLKVIARALNVDAEFLLGWDEQDDLESKNTYGDHQANLKHLEDKPELLHIYNDIYNSESLQLLFDKTQDLTPDDLEMVLTIISGIRKERGLD
ncbi:helix-turn-helix domain-containing protein [Erysipelothrix aquatica]|uniref:helix-turn-helix domain-containing protein n=1 Tax=Erysipelothrix aquatica TaxID=2683714 RepID=UPI00135718BC|nr:helix-turn-helix transcriptional regulator [Erysipelothrix aquatica]